MKKYLIFGSIIFSGLLFSGCSVTSNQPLSGNDQLKEIAGDLQKNNNDVVADNTASSTKDERVLTTSAETNDWKLYRNNHYGFELTFPESWKDFKAAGRILTTGKSIDFGFADQENGLFNVSIFEKQKWAEVKNEGGAPTYLGENDKYAFAWAPAQFASNDTMSERLKEVSGIVKTFNAFNMVAGKTYKDLVSKYSYVCPTNFDLTKSTDFNGKVSVSECTRTYLKNSPEFGNSLNVKVEFVPTNLSDTVKSGNKLLSVKKIDDIRTTAGATAYELNNFSGWVSATPAKGGSINYIARREAAGGYYEIRATIILKNDAISKDATERQAMVDKVFESFLITK